MIRPHRGNRQPDHALSFGGFIMVNKRFVLGSLAGLLLWSIAPTTVCGGERVADKTSPDTRTKAITIGAVAYSPGSVTVFVEICRYLSRNGLPADFVLYSNYDALVEALHKRQVDIAWNTPLAHAQYHQKAGDASQTLVMRDVDCNFRSILVARTDANIHSLGDLKGKTLILGSRQAAEATVLPVHFLEKAGLNMGRVKIHSLDGKLDLRGNPCSSEIHVLKALQEGVGNAGVIGERLWNRLSREQPDQVSGLAAVWTSPPFSHCVFTAAANFDKALASQFIKLMLAMDPKEHTTAQAMRLEGTQKWVAGSPEGFQELLKALREDCGCCSAESDAAKP
jgi:ABC-type phosphate/phosphonate transport system substrate-binding protein